MDIIIITRNGIPETPRCFHKPHSAEAWFDNWAENYFDEPEYEEIDRHIDHSRRLDEALELLHGTEVDIMWFTDLITED